MMNISAAFLSAVLVYSKADVQGCSQEKLFWKFLKKIPTKTVVVAPFF